MLNQKFQFPAFQFNDEEQVYPALQEHLPRLLSSGRSEWDICFWLFSKQAAALTEVKPNAALLKKVSFNEVLKVGKIAKELS